MSSASTSPTGAAPNIAWRSRTAREQARELGRTVGVLADLPGPKMRTGPIIGGEVVLETGEEFVLTSGDIEGDQHRVTTTVANLS